LNTIAEIRYERANICLKLSIADVGEELDVTISKSWPDGVVKLVRSKERLGLVRARLFGAAAATGDVLVFLDAHCEVNQQWYKLSHSVLCCLG